jgi:hypothetical protein
MRRWGGRFTGGKLENEPPTAKGCNPSGIGENTQKAIGRIATPSHYPAIPSGWYGEADGKTGGELDNELPTANC